MKYPIFNPLAYWAIFLIDCALKPFFKNNLPISTPKKILLCNTAHLGDVILTTALLPVLKKIFPEAKIGMLVGSWSRELLEGHSLVDQIHVIDHWKVSRKRESLFKKLHRYFNMRKQVRQELLKSHYDLAIDCCFHFPNMAPLLWSVKIPMRIGFASAGFSPLLTHTQAWDHTKNLPAVESYFSLLNCLDVEKEKNFLRPTLEIPTQAKEHFILIHMGAGSEQKKWPAHKWKSLAKWLVEEREVLLFSGRGVSENREIQEVIRDLPRAYNLCDTLNGSEFSALIQKAQVLIGVDTSAGHLAAAVGTPAVLLYTGIHPQKIWSPYGGEVNILTHPVSCSPCFRGCKSMQCVREITVEEVYQAVRVIKPRPTRPASSSSINSLISSKGTS